MAEDALIEARTNFDYSNGNGPIAVYQCEDCGDFHLTSKGPVNEKLAKAQTDGQIDKNKQANHWLEKFKRK
jgi:hypothetical protein